MYGYANPADDDDDDDDDDEGKLFFLMVLPAWGHACSHGRAPKSGEGGGEMLEIPIG